MNPQALLKPIKSQQKAEQALSSSRNSKWLAKRRRRREPARESGELTLDVNLPQIQAN